MMLRRTLQALALIVLTFAGGMVSATPDPDKDILVTFRNDGASALSGSIRAPYRARKRYAISASARRDADAVASEYALEPIDHWPIRSLGVYCFVYRIPDGASRESIIAALQSDQRVESVQPLQSFDSATEGPSPYNDTYVGLQHGLDLLGIALAHEISRGDGIRIAVIDSNVDANHEDLRGQVRRIKNFLPPSRLEEADHGTAVVSVIGASANNAAGIVGVAPEATIELLVSCWSSPSHDGAVCDSFTLAKALDALADDPPDILNMSISGPEDPLLGRLVDVLVTRKVVIVAADTAGPGERSGFPASRPGVVAVGNAHLFASVDEVPDRSVFAPGDQIMVAVPSDEYDFRSGSSLAAAHVSGVVALMLAEAPDVSPAAIHEFLRISQHASDRGIVSVDACRALDLVSGVPSCRRASDLALSKADTSTQ